MRQMTRLAQFTLLCWLLGGALLATGRAPATTLAAPPAPPAEARSGRFIQPPPPPPAAPPAARTTGTLSGSVYQADGTTPIARNVWITAAAVGSGQTYTVALNDAAGRYTLGGLPAGQYIVRAAGIGWAVEYYPNAGPIPPAATPVSVSAGATTPGVNFSLAPGGAIAGRILDASSGLPIANAYIQLADGYQLSACSAADGRYVINSIPLDTPVRIAAGGDAYCPGGEGLNYVKRWWQAADAYAAATPIVLTGSAPNASGIDFALSGGGSISGRVVRAADGVPVGSAVFVTVQHAGTYQQIASARVGSDGRYTVRGLPAGQYVARAEGGGFALAYYPNAGPTGSAATRITVLANSDTPNIDFALTPGGTLSGVARAAAGGAPLPNVPVELNGAWLGVCTDAQGAYTVSGLPYNLTVTLHAGGGQNPCLGGPPLYLREWWQEAATAAGATPLSVSAAQPHRVGLNFTLALGGGVRGRVTQADGVTPVGAGGRVALSAPTAWAPVETLTVAADGQYAGGPLPPGTYVALAWATGFGQQFYAARGIALADATPIVISAGSVRDAVDFALPVGGTISGVVRNQTGSAPLAGVVVGIDGAAALQACSNAAGGYTLSNVPHGLPLRVHAGGGACPPDSRRIDREWWQEAATPGAATPITLSAAQPDRGAVNFTLRQWFDIWLPVALRE